MIRALAARRLSRLCLIVALLQAAMPLHAATMAVNAWRLAIGVCSVMDDRPGLPHGALAEVDCAVCVAGAAGLPGTADGPSVGPGGPAGATLAREDRALRVDRAGPPPATGPPAIAG